MLTITLHCLGESALYQPDPPVFYLPGGATVGQVLARLHLPAEPEHIILLDGGPATAATILTRNCTVSLVPIVGGG